MHDVGGGDSALLVTGWKVCSQLSAGATPQQLADLALQRSDSDLGAKGLSPQQAAALINYAQADLCPNAPVPGSDRSDLTPPEEADGRPAGSGISQ